MENEIYVLFQGSAQLKPVSAEKLELIFLDDNGNPTKRAITFSATKDPDTGETKPLMFKAASLDLILQCDKANFEALERSGEVNQYFPKTYYKITETDLNRNVMNPPDPPIGRG
ncbi:hypothetical protein GCM10028803_30470 [Larkinella knui]|uniref:Uncharacterized protein n=1 Tax=Larkinella knui TaxID=2025310 RepID=A0A3P1CXM8_9BACT|nr:hypothetical protein [Larkinella knui]RRB18075.1 hypothetical protein EHT87_07320 [Larkinella knui]